MNREIKFRGKQKDNGQWVYGGFTLDAAGEPRITTVTEDKEGLVFNKVIPETVGQFTGLLDKNGKKIFEGDILFEDILDCDPTHKNIPDYCVIVSMKDGCFGYEPTHYSKVHPDDQKWQPFYDSGKQELINMNYFDVIGNATDNPELLEAK